MIERCLLEALRYQSCGTTRGAVLLQSSDRAGPSAQKDMNKPFNPNSIYSEETLRFSCDKRKGIGCTACL